MAQKLKVLIILKNWQHHAQSSGYSILFNDLTHRNIEFRTKHHWPFSNLLRSKVIRKISDIFHFQASLISLEKIVFSWYLRANKFSMVHFTAFEDYSLNLKIKGVHFVYSVHVPLSQLILYPNINNRIQENNIYLLVSKSQKVRFQNIRTFLLPHPVDISYFQPNHNLVAKYAENMFRVMICGVHLRDYKIVLEVVKLCAGYSNIVFEIVFPSRALTGNSFMLDIFNDLVIRRNVKVNIDISDERLREIYQNSHVLFIPLYDATANNSILEAMSSGLPIITNCVEGLKEYVNSSFTITVEERTAKEFLDVILKLENDRPECISMSTQARKYCCENFDTEILKEKYLSIIEQILLD